MQLEEISGAESEERLGTGCLDWLQEGRDCHIASSFCSLVSMNVLNKQ